jgi:uncharacterized protein with von Willebrand factor type A (vWA) domain
MKDVTKEDLMNLLDIPMEDIDDNDHLEERPELEDIPQEEKFDTYLKTTKWDEDQGTRALNEMDIRAIDIHSDIRNKYGKPTRADFYAATFNQHPEVRGPCKDELRHKFMEDLMELPDYQSLHESTRGSITASDIACTELFKQYSKYLENHEQQLEAKAVPGGGFEISRNPSKEDEIASLKAAVSAVRAAQDKVDEYQDTCRGWGLDPDDPSPTNIARIKELFFIAQKNPMIKEVMKRAGRFRRSAQAKQREKVIHGRDDVTGVELGSDIGRLLPVELSKLNHPLLKLDVMRRLVEQQCMQRQLRGVEYKEKGPIIVCVDESGSMAGENIQCAKALALAMCWIAQHQRRPIVLYSFTSGRGYYRAGQSTVPTFEEKKEIAQWMERFKNGGTDLQVPLVVVPQEWSSMVEEGKIVGGKTDKIIITDAVLSISTQMRDDYIEWKKRSQCKTISLVLGTDPGQMKQVSDEVYCFTNISVGTAAVDACFSV